MSSKNLAEFTKNRTGLKVIGDPSNKKLTSHMSISGGKSSVFSQPSHFKSRKDIDGLSSQSGLRFRRSKAAEMHKKRILEVVNQLSE
jgi:hypothetical protein